MLRMGISKRATGLAASLVLSAVLLAATPPGRSQAEEICNFLDRIVASATDGNPFDSERFASAPNAECAVRRSNQAHIDSGVRWIFTDPKHVPSFLCLWRNKGLADAHEALLEAKKIIPLGEDERVEKCRRLRRDFLTATKHMRAEALDFVRSIHSCVKEGKIRGSWHSFWDDQKYGEAMNGPTYCQNLAVKTFQNGHWGACQSNGPVCIWVLAHVPVNHIVLQIWDGVKSRGASK